MAVTVITDEARPTTAEVVDGAVVIDPVDLPAAIGWTLQPEGSVTATCVCPRP